MYQYDCCSSPQLRLVVVCTTIGTDHWAELWQLRKHTDRHVHQQGLLPESREQGSAGEHQQSCEGHQSLRLHKHVRKLRQRQRMIQKQKGNSGHLNKWQFKENQPREHCVWSKVKWTKIHIRHYIGLVDMFFFFGGGGHSCMVTWCGVKALGAVCSILWSVCVHSLHKQLMSGPV